MEAGNNETEVSVEEINELNADGTNVGGINADGTEESGGSEEKEPEKIHLQTKTVPAFITLLAGAIAAIYTRLQNYKIINALICILVTLLVFWFIGDVVKHLLDKIEIDPPEEENPGGEDIEMENVETRQIEE